ncbi:transposase [Synechococcus sp. CCY9201]|uniref:transposase n=1 Tax=Synechococcus sp. CCY9201 TaxID=174697 RepID=UPI003A4C6F79
MRLLYACYEDLAFRVLTGNQQPDHSRISEVRRRNLDALKGLFIQIPGRLAISAVRHQRTRAIQTTHGCPALPARPISRAADSPR